MSRATLAASAGSSPRMRGKLYKRPPASGRTGLIPAHAGKTFGEPHGIAQGRAHPRACGENAAFKALDALDEGSSPRMRGKHSAVMTVNSLVGLIPAHAGKTFEQGDTHITGGAHPRACGENYAVKHASKLACGSSPRMRGKRPSPLPALQGIRLIPAHAGKTARGNGMADACKAHPRACGENFAGYKLFHRVSGSSPRMRGKR